MDAASASTTATKTEFQNPPIILKCETIREMRSDFLVGGGASKHPGRTTRQRTQNFDHYGALISGQSIISVFHKTRCSPPVSKS
jgi:hypothetical protein